MNTNISMNPVIFRSLKLTAQWVHEYHLNIEEDEENCDKEVLDIEWNTSISFDSIPHSKASSLVLLFLLGPRT